MSSSASGSANANAPALDINEFLDIAEFNRGLATIFNMDLFNTPVNETSDEIHYNTYVLARIVDYKVSSTCQGLELLGSFKKTLRIGRKTTSRRSIKDHGILVNLKNRDRLPEWDEDDLRDAILYENGLPTPTRTPQTFAIAITTPAPTPAPVTPDLNLPQDPPNDQSLPLSRSNQQQQELMIRPAIDREAYRTVPPVQVPNEDLDPAIANQFSKLWDRKLNYSGDAYDILDDKIRYFLDACLTAASNRHNSTLCSQISSRRAKNFFVHQVSRDSTFAEMYQKMKQH
ncbi:uncharacterized protein HRG_11960 [Hirsutella rhossiliensis]|uniref:Uncharacterized protein n=1 Tax=Hirsutella rhossiliensis TaxID=111463 RepID=A0A9P8MID9_9HYPO|nr:uncharacterized protein HRG_11960 [Hirsutella rhossiliensis]KAH0956953.1 hypothetical protein HRG_11960 [Hirsutella rhossiliensis]